MKIVVAAMDEQWNELTGNRPEIEWQRVNDCNDFATNNDADAFFNLKDHLILPEFVSLGKPVFINAVIQTLADLKAPDNILRINGWAGFLQRPAWEIAGAVNENIKLLFENLDIKINAVKDEPGFIAARIIAMIINEAYFTVSDQVSSKTEIDTAMKLGTNYPYGPFEWAGLIGKKNILELLQKLSLTDKRYQPAELLIQEVKENN
ncbi:MAG: 3-hydroxyacyl-CoA dehydrogenase family protein [Ferruginibacter sp.]